MGPGVNKAYLTGGVSIENRVVTGVCGQWRVICFRAHLSTVRTRDIGGI